MRTCPPLHPSVGSTLMSAIRWEAFVWGTPTSSSSASLWASFGSQLDLQLSSMAAGWTCDRVPPYGNTAINKAATAYMGRGQTDLPPSQVQPLPCISTFPGVPVAGAITLPSVTVEVSKGRYLWCVHQCSVPGAAA